MKIDSVELNELLSNLPWFASDGDSEKFSFRITELATNGSTEVFLPAPGVTAIVGGNNVGKSTLLQQIFDTANSTSLECKGNPKVLNHLGEVFGGTPADTMAWLLENVPVQKTPNGVYLSNKDVGESIEYLAQKLANYHTPYGFAGLFISASRAFERVTLTEHVQAKTNIEDPPSHPLHVFAMDTEASKELIGVVQEIFGEDLTLDTVAASQGYRLGNPGMNPPLLGQVTTEYAGAMARLPKLSAQGDGLRSAVGLLMPLIAQTTPVMLVDEPEAFLHPPQARTLGRAVARLATEKGIQIILATHDRNFLMGLLEWEQADLSILNLTRESSSSKSHMLSNGKVRDLFSDSLLRYSHAVDGLFSKAVVLTENERDSTFYSAAIEEFLASEGVSAPADIHFVSVSGKHRMAGIAERLRDMGMRVFAIADLDVLDDKSLLNRLVDSLGGDWVPLEADYLRATEQFRRDKKHLTRGEALILVSDYLKSNPDAPFTGDTAKRVKEILRTDNPWHELKYYGMSAFRQQRESANRLIDSLDALGLVTVKVGELERFSPLDTSKGSQWLGVALENGVHKMADSQNHAKRVLAVARPDLLPTSDIEQSTQPSAEATSSTS